MQNALVEWLPQGHEETADLAVIIVSLNVKALLIANLAALRESLGTARAELIVVDNGSTDGTIAALEAGPSSFRLIKNHRNRGFSAANLQGMLVMRARHVLLLNPDMRVEPEAIQRTVDYLDQHAEVGVISGCLLREQGGILPTVRRFPQVWSQLAILLKLPYLFPRVLDHYLCKTFDYAQEQAVDSVRGSYFAIHQQAWRQFGGLDTRYFIWFEEVDYCRQVWHHGWQVKHVPSIRATDYVGQFFKQRRRLWTQWHFTRSMVQYFRKWHRPWQASLLVCVRPIGLIIAWVADVFQLQRRIKSPRT